jgi:hypothetical protein
MNRAIIYSDADEEEIQRVFDRRRRDLAARSSALANSLERVMTSLLDALLASLVVYVAVGLIEFGLQVSLSNAAMSLADAEASVKQKYRVRLDEPPAANQVLFRGVLPLHTHMKFKAKDSTSGNATDVSNTIRPLLSTMGSEMSSADHLMAAVVSSSRSCSPSNNVAGSAPSIDQWMTSNSSLANINRSTTNFSETKV